MLQNNLSDAQEWDHGSGSKWSVRQHTYEQHSGRQHSGRQHSGGPHTGGQHRSRRGRGA
jgi:hypothetical protein